MRRGIMMVVVVAMVLCTAGSAPAAVTAVCNGTECGGDGPRNYWYEVTTTQQYDDFSFHVVTGDPTVANYSNPTAAILVGGNWEEMDYADYDFNLFGFGGQLDIHSPMTAHGNVATPNGTLSRVVFWTVNGPLSAGTYGFGYDNGTDPMDVSWVFDPGGTATGSDWSKPVGMGKGPVHAPSPEPATLSLLAVGIGTLLLKRRQA